MRTECSRATYGKTYACCVGRNVQNWNLSLLVYMMGFAGKGLLLSILLMLPVAVVDVDDDFVNKLGYAFYSIDYSLW